MFDFLLKSDLLSSLVAFGLVLIPAVIVHEFGHLLAAKAVGITILEFGIGYPPKIARLFRWRETDFTLNLIPLGGFVRPLGEDMIKTLSEAETEAARAELAALEPGRMPAKIRTVNEAKPLSRIVFMAAGAIANVLAALLVFVVIGLIGVDQPIGEAYVVGNVTSESPLYAIAGGQEFVIETVNGAPYQSLDDLLTAVESETQPVVLGVLLRPVDDGPFERREIELTFSPEQRAALRDFRSRLVIESIQLNSPAYMAGLQLRDAIIGIGGVDLQTSSDPFRILQEINEESAGSAVPLIVVRGDAEVTLEVTPRINPAPGQGYLGAGVTVDVFSTGLGASLYSAGPLTKSVPLALPEAIAYGVSEIRNVLDAILGLPARLLSGTAAPEEGRVISILGISQIGGSFLQDSIETGSPTRILSFVALVNIALGLTNLLPLPPLDGGRILFIVIEILRGKPLSQRREEAIMIIGMLFLLAIGIVVIVQDIRDPILNLLPR